MNPKVLVIGGTGMLGLPVARQLKDDSFQVTILTTNIDQARTRLGDEFELVFGDVTDPESLKKPLDGQDIVYLNLNAKHDAELYQAIEIEGSTNVAKAAREAGIKRIGMISGASSNGEEEGIIFIDAKVKAERALIESGVPYTIMRPSWFFESLPFFIQKGRAGYLGKQPIPRGWLAATDYARQVSKAFDTDEAANKCFYNLGPQKISIPDAITQFCARHYPELKVSSLSYGMAKMAAMIPGQEGLRQAIPFFKYFETRPEDVSTAEADRILGPNLTTLEEWLDSYQKPD
ncbi:MAG: NAD(P)H-binding protein [candidate division Zixibacteria bacterium]|nr:NAD(P)H-binding protein [candidate division Zixibacteria bacterium]